MTPQISKMEIFVTVLNDFQLLTIVAKFFKLDACRDPGYAFASLSSTYEY